MMTDNLASIEGGRSLAEKRAGKAAAEISEKAKPRAGPYVPSGIYRNDNTWLYCIGDYDTIFIFAKTTLRRMHTSGRWLVFENLTRTSEGFLLREHEADVAAAAILRPNAAEAVGKVIADVAALGELLHRAAKGEQVGQLDLFRERRA